MVDTMDARDKIRLAVRASGMKQAAVAQRAGLTQQQLCGIVNKRRKMDADELFAICAVLGIAPGDVFEGT